MLPAMILQNIPVRLAYVQRDDHAIKTLLVHVVN